MVDAEVQRREMPAVMSLLGVYKLPVTDELTSAQAELFYGDKPSKQQRERVRHQLESTVLVEVRVSDADDRFKVDDFAQENPQLPRESWQVAWAEAFLTGDGQQLLVERWDPLPADQRDFRVAFFIHNWNSELPLRTSYGVLPNTQLQEMPDRLASLVPYELVD